MEMTINEQVIKRLIVFDKHEFVVGCSMSPFIKIKSKGAVKSTFLFGLIHTYYKQDMYCDISSPNILYTLEQATEYIKNNTDVFQACHLIDIDGVLYEKPKVVFELISNEHINVHFDTIEECVEYVNNIKETTHSFIDIQVD